MVLPGVVLKVVVSGVVVVVCDTGRAFEGCPITKFNTIVIRDFKEIFKYKDSNTNIINLIITKHGETQQTLT